MIRWRDRYRLFEACYEDTVHALEHRIRQIPGHTSYKVGKRYNFIPMQADMVVHELERVQKYAKEHRKRATTFLDVGCGIGNILMIAKNMGFEVHGIECDETILRYALFQVFEDGDRYTAWDGIWKMDAFQFTKYDKYDVVYFYCPMCDENMEIGLEKMLLEKVRPGAFIISAGSRMLWSRKIEVLDPVSDYTFVKKRLRKVYGD